ncbi:ABC-2 type transport system ATP-binding protein [Anaeromicropila populeti]|uniref:ABC-2 type transport system ATP-binding protein n=2 Tax=Anaeromicropila populeti TaxID=37658 RepID=A0A1I6HRG9_9FIRM|nr:ABC-2 type transport system ATP-binding protein [Anaeromicropila populeti]
MLQLENISIAYGKCKVVEDLNLDIAEGEMFGLVGPSGAGKTSILRVIAGIIKPNGGAVRVDDINIVVNEKKRKRMIGYLPADFGSYESLKVSEYLQFYASTYGYGGKKTTEVCNQALSFVHLEQRENELVDGLSRGMKQQLSLARSIIHNPRVLVLDEPYSGVDPIALKEIKKILVKLRQLGKTILITSHMLPEISDICTSFGVLDRGKMIIHGKTEEVITSINVINPIVIQILEGEEKALKILKEEVLVRTVSIEDKRIAITFSGDEYEQAKLLTKLTNSGVLIGSYNRIKGDFDALFNAIVHQPDLNGGER